MIESSDAELMALVKDGDRAAFAQLVERHKDAVVSYLRLITGSADSADDLGQETFLRLYTRAGSYREQGKLSGYLYRIATNLARSQQRKRQRKQLLLHALGRNGNGQQAARSPQRQLLDKEIATQLAEAIAGIPMRFRAPLLLNTVQELSYREVAQALGCREGTVKSRISRGRDLLRRKLGDALEPEVT